MPRPTGCYESSMPRPRFEKLDLQRRNAILDAAEDEFITRGFSGASYNQIIERAGVSKGAMYYYFDDKEDLFLTVVQRELVGLLGALGGIGPVASASAFWEGVEAMFMRAVAYMQSSPRVSGLMRAVAGLLGSPDCPAGVRALLEQARVVTSTIVETGQAAGAIRRDLPTSLLVSWFMAVGEASDVWMAQHWAELAPEEIPTITAKVLDIFRRIAAPSEA